MGNSDTGNLKREVLLNRMFIMLLKVDLTSIFPEQNSVLMLKKVAMYLFCLVMIILVIQQVQVILI